MKKVLIEKFWKKFQKMSILGLVVMRMKICEGVDRYKKVHGIMILKKRII